MSAELRDDIKLGQIWISPDTQNRWKVIQNGFNTVKVQALDGGRFGDSMYWFHPAMFGTTLKLVA